jgi:hypothetical protein
MAAGASAQAPAPARRPIRAYAGVTLSARAERGFDRRAWAAREWSLVRPGAACDIRCAGERSCTGCLMSPPRRRWPLVARAFVKSRPTLPSAPLTSNRPILPVALERRLCNDYARSATVLWIRADAMAAGVEGCGRKSTILPILRIVRRLCGQVTLFFFAQTERRLKVSGRLRPVSYRLPPGATSATRMVWL